MATLQDFYDQMTKESMFRGAEGGYASAAPMPMEEGGIVEEPTKAVVGEAGDEAVIPLEKHPGKSCDEAHPDQTHEEWAAGRKEDAEEMLEESGKTAADSLDPVKETHQNWAPQTEEGSTYKAQLGEAITRSEDTGQEKNAMDKVAAAEYDAAGRIFARGFYDELEKVARHPFLGGLTSGGAMKAVGRGGLYGGLGLAALAALASRNPAMASEMGVPSPDVSTSGPDWERVIAAKAARRSGDETPDLYGTSPVDWADPMLGPEPPPSTVAPSFRFGSTPGR